jgi:hypothetical protein
MNAASEPARPSIMTRVARVRKRMQIEVNIGIPASSKTLFLPLCQDYEQRDETYFYTKTGYSGVSSVEQSLPPATLQQKNSSQHQRDGITKLDSVTDSSSDWKDDWADKWGDWDKQTEDSMYI